MASYTISGQCTKRSEFRVITWTSRSESVGGLSLRRLEYPRLGSWLKVIYSSILWTGVRSVCLCVSSVMLPLALYLTLRMDAAFRATVRSSRTGSESGGPAVIPRVLNAALSLPLRSLAVTGTSLSFGVFEHAVRKACAASRRSPAE